MHEEILDNVLPSPSIDGQVEVSQDGRTVWVHAYDGSTVGRFSIVFGMDVHTTVAEQLQGASQCLHCTHTRPGQAEWQLFCQIMHRHYGITVPPSLVRLEGGA